jgi:hypothetical protein
MSSRRIRAGEIRETGKIETQSLTKSTNTLESREFTADV